VRWGEVCAVHSPEMHTLKLSSGGRRARWLCLESPPLTDPKEWSMQVLFAIEIGVTFALVFGHIATVVADRLGRPAA
jgi:hypothetical protein